jgi:hypothetical protein
VYNELKYNPVPRKENVPQILTRKIVIPKATPFLTLSFVRMFSTHLSKMGVIPKASHTRRGLKKFMPTQRVPYTPKNVFHCPGARGETLYFLVNMMKDAHRVPQ